MRFMVLVKATAESEAETGPLGDRDAEAREALFSAMGNYNEELVKAGVMLAGEGLHPSSKGVRVRFSGSTRTVIDGPFAETTELVAGYWLWQVNSMEEAIEWLKRAPFDNGEEVEIRPVGLRDGRLWSGVHTRGSSPGGAATGTAGPADRANPRP